MPQNTNNIIIILFLISFSFCTVDEDKMRKRMQSLYGENKEITGDYDKSLSVTCNNGIFVGKKTKNVISFKGIPYAKPPIGSLRWKDPVLPENSNKIYQAYYFGKSCIQTEWQTQYGSYYPNGEDCLHLNIWVNTNNTSTNKPIMVFIHGGSFGWGGTSDPLYDGYNLIDKFSDIILVTLDYRLGLLGFINFSSVPGGENYKTTSNLGLLDQICALKWIQNNINKFGGDPGKVTIFGQSGGAASASLLPLIEGSEGLFKRIIAESGSVSLTFSSKECKMLIEKFLEKSGSKTMEDLVSISEAKIKEINEEIFNYLNYAERDGITLPLDLYGAYKSGKGKDIDMLLGTNKDESRYWMITMGYYTNLLSGEFIYKHGLPILYENNIKVLSDEDKEYVKEFMHIQNPYQKKIWKITEFYNELLFRTPMNKMAEYHSEAGGNTYVYLWKYPGENEDLGAFHCIEISYIFNNLQETEFTGNKVNPELANKVQEMWTNFARTGNPSTSEHIWEKYDSNTRKTMILDEKINMEENYKSEQRELIEPLLDYYLNGNFGQLSYNVPQVYKIVAQLGATLAIFIGIIILLKK